MCIRAAIREIIQMIALAKTSTPYSNSLRRLRLQSAHAGSKSSTQLRASSILASPVSCRSPRFLSAKSAQCLPARLRRTSYRRTSCSRLTAAINFSFRSRRPTPSRPTWRARGTFYLDHAVSMRVCFVALMPLPSRYQGPSRAFSTS